MNITDLKSIVNHCDAKPGVRIMVQIRYADGSLENCDVETFQQFSDCFVLNINSDVKPSENGKKKV